MIRVEELTVLFGDVVGLTLAALGVERGEHLGVAGPNGSGKTTLLRVLAGLQQPTAGRVQGVPPPGRTVLVHQRPYMFRGTAAANVAYALRLRGLPRSGARGLLERLGAAHLAGRRAKALSGGERRRVAIARALAVAPQVLLLDEPYAELDGEGTAAVDRAVETFEGTLVIAAPRLSEAPLDRVVDLAAAPATLRPPSARREDHGEPPC